MKKFILVTVFLGITQSLFAGDTLELTKAIKQVFENGKENANVIMNGNKSVQTNQAQPLIIPETKEEVSKKKVDSDQNDIKIADTKLKIEQSIPRPIGYSRIGGNEYAYIKISQKIFKVSKGDTIAGYTVGKITRDYIEMKTPFDSNPAKVKIVYEIASVNADESLTSQGSTK